MRHIITALTGRDNSSIDIGRVLWVASVIALFIFQAHSVWSGHAFDPIAFCTGAAAILAGGGAGVALKVNAEPEEPRCQ